MATGATNFVIVMYAIVFLIDLAYEFLYGNIEDLQKYEYELDDDEY